ncbi:MAG: aconitase X catalytic domain-containing protein [Candidatus Altiarchaeota archaeon]|nr:aconitase X catalytic domain-containing protein [Candidatus Altiarchaeota archaeon]
MHLTKKEKDMLQGSEGKGIQRAMEILSALGEIYNAEKLIPVESVQVSGVSFKNLGDAGLEFLEGWAETGVKARVKAFLNPAGMDLKNWRELGFPKEFAVKQLRLIDVYRSMDLDITCTCTPYLAGNKPSLGEHIAWSESSAVSYANSVLGARTNRESGISALSSALTGLTPEYGFHLDANRRADYVVDVSFSFKSESDYSALGYMVGKRVGGGIPYFRGLSNPSKDQLKSLGAAMAASGSVAMYHVENVTPEANPELIKKDAPVLEINDLAKGYAGLNSETSVIDLVSIGCPHASIKELEEIASMLNGERVKTTLWITTSRYVKQKAKDSGLLDRIQDSGAVVVSDTCMVVAPVEDLGFSSMATNSGKMAFYAPAHCGLRVRFGSLRKCINSALTGRWES